MTDFTEDGFLDGRLRVRQSARGFRSGLDAAMLAAAVPARDGDRVLELGVGAGVASLCLAARVPQCRVEGLDIDEELVALANRNAAANKMADRIRFLQGDALSLPRELRTEFDHVLCNPPFHDAKAERSPDDSRALALQDCGDLSGWLKSGLKRTANNGTFTTILRADRLNEALDVLPTRGARVFPLWPKKNEPAKRVIVQVHRGRHTPFALLPGLVLHEADGRYTRGADAILRGMSALPIGSV